MPLLKKYEDQTCCFNDDIQGTAGVAAAGLYTACRFKKEKMSDQRILFLGAGSAGCGIAELVVAAMIDGGLTEEQARKQVWLFDVDGLLTKDRVNDLLPFQKPFAVDHAPSKDFVASIRVDLPRWMWTEKFGVAESRPRRRKSARVDGRIMAYMEEIASQGRLVVSRERPVDKAGGRGKILRQKIEPARGERLRALRRGGNS